MHLGSLSMEKAYAATQVWNCVKLMLEVGGNLVHISYFQNV